MAVKETVGKVLEAIQAINGEMESKVVKSLPMKNEWRKKWAELEKAKNEEIQLERKRKALHRAFWAAVEQDTEIYADMRYNTETDEIEVLAED